MPKLQILFEDNHLLVINKQAGLPTMGTDSGPTVHSLAAQYIKHSCGKPGRVFLGIVSRLDAMTSGVLVLARTSKAASRLAAQFASKSLPTSPANRPKKKKGAAKAPRKIYLAIAQGAVDTEAAQWSDLIYKDESAHRMRLSPEPHPEAQHAALRYQRIAEPGSDSIHAVELITGRKHQIRTQFADRGHPILGDRKYGSTRSFDSGIALHSWRLQIEHPTKRVPMWFEAPLPSSWSKFQTAMPTPSALRSQIESCFPPPSPEPD